MSEYVNSIVAEVKAKNPSEPEFHQAVEEVANLTIDECDGCLIRTDGNVPLVVGNNILVIAKAFV